MALSLTVVMDRDSLASMKKRMEKAHQDSLTRMARAYVLGKPMLSAGRAYANAKADYEDAVKLVGKTINVRPLDKPQQALLGLAVQAQGAKGKERKALDSRAREIGDEIFEIVDSEVTADES
jgi:hypothetical protein